MPERIQQRRTKGWRLPLGAKSVARPSRWGNPYKVLWRDCSLDGMCWQVSDDQTTAPHFNSQRDAARYAVREFQEWLPEHWRGRRGLIAIELRGLDLACWCPPDQPCHADVLLEIANA